MHNKNIEEFLNNLSTNMSVYCYDLAVIISEDILTYLVDLVGTLKYDSINAISKTIEFGDIIKQYKHAINNLIYKDSLIERITDTNSQVVIKHLIEYITEYSNGYIRSVIESMVYNFNNIIRASDISQLSGDPLKDYDKYCRNDVEMILENSLPDISFTLIPNLTDKVDNIVHNYIRHTVTNDIIFNIWNKLYKYIYYTVNNNPYFITIPMLWIKDTVKIFIIQLEGVRYG